jgi:hypothetical protein
MNPATSHYANGTFNLKGNTMTIAYVVLGVYTVVMLYVAMMANYEIYKMMFNPTKEERKRHDNQGCNYARDFKKCSKSY